MLAHLTLGEAPYAMKMGVRPLVPDCLIDVDPAAYAAELALKDAILAGDYGYYSRALPGTDALQWETIEMLLPNMARQYPTWFGLVMDGDRWRWTNRLLGVQTAFVLGDLATLPLPPLDWVARQVQEDLCLMDGNAAGAPLVAGHLCFGSGWCLNDKLGLPLLAIHAPVPGFADSIGRSADLLLERLKVGHPVARVNWTIHPSDRLNDAPALRREYAFEHDGVTTENAGERLHLRSEWQTLVRYPRTNAVLFTIRTRVRSLRQALVTDEDACRLAGLVQTMPPELRTYKGVSRHVDVLLAWLDRRARSGACGEHRLELR